MVTGTEPFGPVYVNTVGLEGVPVPDTVSTVVPSVSVKTPVALTLIWFPLASVTLAAPAPV